MGKKTQEKSVAFFERNSWYHRTKALQDNGIVKYGKKGGFSSQAEAEASYRKCEEEFNTLLRKQQLSGKSNKDVFFKDYLIYWFEEVFSKRIEATTRMVGAYALYDLIIPNIDYDIKMRFVSVEYLDGLLERTSKDNWYLEILLGLFCGLRKGEIYGLKFSDFDLERRSVKISRQIVANPIIKEGSRIEENILIERDPKTPNSFRVLRVPEVIITELEKRKCLIDMYKEKMQEAFIDNDYISCQANGKVHSLSAMNNALTKLCVRNGLPAVTVHGLRHMFATILVEQGVPLVKISGLLGHSSVNTTFEYYCDVMDEKEKIITFMNDAFIPEGREGTG